MIRYTWGCQEYEAITIEEAIKVCLARQTFFYDHGKLESMSRRIDALEAVVVTLLTKLPVEEALGLFGATLVDKGFE